MKGAFPRIVLPVLAVAGAAPLAAAQDQSDRSRIETEQIDAPSPSARKAESKAYLDDASASPPRRDPMLAPGAQVTRAGNAPTPQITAAGQGGPGMMQLAPDELDATLAQLTAAERQVLMQAITGTDICDNPPDVPAVIALCRSRLETRSADFALSAPEVSAEERLIRFDLDNGALPSVGQVIERLARGSSGSDDFSNQAIASFALGSTPPARAEEEKPEGEGLSQETQSLINAIINQLGGPP